jgi:hypothetical protein
MENYKIYNDDNLEGSKNQFSSVGRGEAPLPGDPIH